MPKETRYGVQDVLAIYNLAIAYGKWSLHKTICEEKVLHSEVLDVARLSK